jgi:hypothetical protein
MEIGALIKDVLQTKLKLQIQAFRVDDTDVSDQWKVFVDRTWYLNDGRQFVMNDNLYKVVSFSPNEFLIVEGVQRPQPTIFQLPDLYFKRGKYAKLMEELALEDDDSNYNTFVYLKEPFQISYLQNWDSAINYETTVQLIFCSVSNFQDFTTEEDYRQVINPMNEIIDAFVSELRFDTRFAPLRNSGQRTNHSKITTISQPRQVEGELFIGRYYSGVLLQIPLRVYKDFCTPPRFVPPPPPPPGQGTVLTINGKVLTINEKVLILTT